MVHPRLNEHLGMEGGTVTPPAPPAARRAPARRTPSRRRARATATLTLAAGLLAGLAGCSGDAVPEGTTRPLSQVGRNGIVTAEGLERYEDGEWVKHGNFVFRDDRGEVISTGAYRGGLETGPWSQVYEDGSRGEGDFLEGRRTGPWRTFHPNGAAQDQGVYEDGLREGQWVSRRRDGTLLRQATYREGELNGPVTYYGADGTTVDPARTGIYRDGELVTPTADR